MISTPKGWVKWARWRVGMCISLGIQSGQRSYMVIWTGKIWYKELLITRGEGSHNGLASKTRGKAEIWNTPGTEIQTLCESSQLWVVVSTPVELVGAPPSGTCRKFAASAGYWIKLHMVRRHFAAKLPRQCQGRCMWDRSLMPEKQPTLQEPAKEENEREPGSPFASSVSL